MFHILGSTFSEKLNRSISITKDQKYNCKKKLGKTFVYTVKRAPQRDWHGCHSQKCEKTLTHIWSQHLPYYFYYEELLTLFLSSILGQL